MFILTFFNKKEGIIKSLVRINDTIVFYFVAFFHVKQSREIVKENYIFFFLLFFFKESLLVRNKNSTNVE